MTKTNRAIEPFGSYRRQLSRYLMRRLGDPRDVDDLAQEVYLRLLRGDEATVIRKPLAYLYGIASHVLADYRSDEAHHRAHLVFEHESDDAGVDEVASLVHDDVAVRLSLQQQLEIVLGSLPATQAAVLIAHKRDGLSYVEVATQLGLSIHTVEKYVTRAKAHMRSIHWER